MKFKAIPIVYDRRDLGKMPRGDLTVFIEASNQTLAHATATRVYRMWQIPVRFVRVEEYRPWEDPYLLNSGFVRPVSETFIGERNETTRR